MGTWEVGPFENDAAADFVVDLADKGWRLVERTINRKIKRDDWAIQELVAACEFVAAANGHPLQGQTFDELDDWLEDHPKFKLDSMVKKLAIERAEALAADSELADVWADAGLHKAWLRTVKNLIGRLRKPAKRRPLSPSKSASRSAVNTPTKKDAKKVLKKYEGATAKQKSVRVVCVTIPAPEEANALLALADTTYMDLTANDKLSPSQQVASVRLLLAGWTKLDWIQITQFKGLSECVDALAKVADRVKSLDLRGCGIGLDVINVLRRFKKLTSLFIEDAGIDDTLVKVIVLNCKNLKELTLWDASLSSKSLTSLGSLKRLKSIVLRCSKISDADTAHFLSQNKKAGWSVERNGAYLSFEKHG